MKASHWPISILSSGSSLINMAMPLFLVRILAPEEVGLFKVFFLYVMFFPAFSMTSGIVNGLYYWAGRDARRDRAFQASSALLLVFGLVFSIAVFGFRAWLPTVRDFGSSQALAFAAAVFGAIAGTFFEEASIARGQVWRGAIFANGFELVRTATVLTVALITHDLAAVFWTHGALSVAKAVVGFAWGYREGIVRFGLEPLRSDATREVLRYAFPVSLAWMFGIFTNYADQLILSTQLTSAAFALYAIGCLTVPPLTIFEFSVTRVLIPSLSKAFDQGDAALAARLYRKAVDELAWILIPAVVGLVVFAQPIIQLLFTDQYAEASKYLSWYALSYLALMIPYDSVARAQGNAKWILGNFTFFSILALGLCFGLTRLYGPMGALAGILISKAAMRAFALFAIRRHLQGFFPLGSILKYAFVATALGVGCWAARPLFRSPVVWFLISGVAFTIAYFSLLFLIAGFRARTVGERPPRVLMLTQYLGIGGLERMILNLSLTLQERRNVAPWVFVFDHFKDVNPDSHLVDVFRAQDIPVETFAKPTGFSLKAVFAIRRAILENDIDVIHSHDLGALIYGVCAKLAVRSSHPVRLVHTQHSFVHLTRRKRYAWYELFFTRFADELCVVSDDTKKSYLEVGVTSARIHSISNGVSFLNEIEARSRVQTSAASAVTVLYMARVHGRKGQEHAIAIWNELAAELRSKIKLVFVGPETERGQTARLLKLIAEAPDRDRIIYHGPTHAPKEWLATADVFLSCSEFEGMPLGPLEAGGSGLPLLLSKIEGHRMLRDHYPLYDLQLPAEGARHLEAIVSEILVSRATGQEAARFERLWTGADWIRKRFSMESMTQHYEKLYLP